MEGKPLFRKRLTHGAVLPLFLYIFTAQARPSPFIDLWQTGTSMHFRTISARGGTYGYDIVSGDKILIHQQTIPGIAGLTGFKRTIDAKKVARLVLNKLNKGIMPPTVAKADLEKLKIMY